MTKDNKPLSRRKILQTTGVALGSLGIVNSVSAKGRKPDANTIVLDVSSIDYVDSAQLKAFSDGNITITASGSEVAKPNEEIPAVRVRARYGNDSVSPSSVPVHEFDPNQVGATIETVDMDQVVESKGSGGGSKKKHSSVHDPNSSLASENTVSVEPRDSDSGIDYTTDYEGGLQVGLTEAAYADINHGQTSRWSTSGGDVTSASDRVWCWYVGPNSSDAKHQAGGFQKTDWSGDTLYSKSFSQYHRNLSYASYYAYLYAALTMNPDGTMGWWGKATTQGNEGQIDPPTSYFFLKSQYFSYCQSWVE